MSSAHPKFAVVGHPNKGKSSIVSSLALDDTVQISDTPGTTTKKRSFPLKIDGKVLYELFDTPGFQRARQVLAWLEKHDVSADKRYKVVHMFIHEHRDNPKFNDEIELLEPIMDGAAIIYVVDASKPYGQEYEAEMEVLRWTGQPSMALINHIDEGDYSEEWKRALGQYFKMVRTFNPMKKSVSQHITVLESMAQLKEEWIAPIKESVEIFERYQEQMIKQSSKEISELIYQSVSYVEKLSFVGEDANEDEKHEVEENYKERLRKQEISTQKSIEKIWNHDHVKKSQKELPLDEIDLFSQESASIFGLTQKELLITAATSGAVTGAGIDLLFAGHTLLLGAGIGAIVGGVSAYLGFDELSEIKVLGQSLGKKYLEIGPMDNRNFPYILLGRALHHARSVAMLSHAKREDLKISIQSSFKEEWLTDDVRNKLEKLHKKFRSDDKVEEKELSEYQKIIGTVLHKLIPS